MQGLLSFIPTQSPGRYTAELPLRRIKLFFIPSKFALCAKYSGVSPDGNYAYVEVLLRPTPGQSDEPSDLLLLLLLILLLLFFIDVKPKLSYPVGCKGEESHTTFQLSIKCYTDMTENENKIAEVRSVASSKRVGS